ncbi:biotinidase-like isoform X1 [Hoplias malabaricus]|uniref:biotinidase-like isoform X1 n=2 Tax=Hoplias malabaricus TaxID=27720 RepID=UPI003462457C
MAFCVLTVVFFSLCLGGLPQVRADGLSYVAAVYEHKVILNPHPRVPQERKAALAHMKQNLDVYEEQTALAAKQGAQIIVFPEDGIHGFNFSRSSIVAYLETVPDPGLVTWSPCADPYRFNNTEVLQRLSCMAQKNHIFLVANLPDCQVCNRSADPHCPPDGQYQFNTDVVFSDNGTIVARYHKQNLFFEDSFDTPPKVEYVTFSTPFAGRFGVFTCFDILFREPVVTLIEDMGIRQLVFPTAWMNHLPLLDAVQFQRAFSYSSGVTLLAANLRAADFRMTGSGIYTPWDSLYNHSKIEQSGKLLVKRIPVLGPSLIGDGVGKDVILIPYSGHPKDNRPETDKDKAWADAALFPRIGGGDCLKEECSVEPNYFYSLMMRDNFTMLPLQGEAGNLTVCDGSLCCHMLFQRTAPQKEELYALGAFNGLHVVHGTYYLEICALVRCTGLEKESCGGGIEHAQTLVDFHLVGTFSTKHVYAGILGSKTTLELPDHSGWESSSRYYMSKTGMTNGLVTAMLYGRDYEKDST